MADFQFFTIIFSQMGLPKAHALQWVVCFFKGLNFTEINILKICEIYVPKKPTIWYYVYALLCDP